MAKRLDLPSLTVDQAFCIDQVSPNSAIQVRDWIGSRFPKQTNIEEINILIVDYAQQCAVQLLPAASKQGEGR